VKHKKFIFAIIVAVALAVVGLAGWLYVNTSTPQIISGRVTKVSNECQSDGTCFVTLDGSKSIVTGCGLMANGKTCKSYDQSKLHAGQQVEATVMKSQTGWYDLECDSCTIRVIGE